MFNLKKFARSSQIIAISCLLLAFTLVCAPIIFSQPIRHAYRQMIGRQIAKIMPARFVFAGDSLTADGNWGWMLARNPLSAANLAEYGASINEVAVQVAHAGAYPTDPKRLSRDS